MRIRKCQYILLAALLVNVVVLYYFWQLQNNLDHVRDAHHHVRDTRWGSEIIAGDPISDILRHPNSDLEDSASNSKVAKLVTVVFREYEFFENDIPETAMSFLKVLPEVKIVILADAYPYPPLQLHHPSAGSVRLVVLHPHLDEPSNTSKPEHYVGTPFVLLVPDSIRLTSASQVREMLVHLLKNVDHQLVAAKVSGENVKCMKLEMRLKEWTLVMSEEDRGLVCDAMHGTGVVLMRSKHLFYLSQPFARPHPYALFVQSVVHHWKVNIMGSRVIFQQGRPLFLDNHLKWKHSTAIKERLKMLYEDFGIKKVVRSGGDVEWYGCTKTTARCFRTVVHDMPEYLFAKRWTPPCCLEGLRETARYVFQTLKSNKVRYWLEGGSLLGAARNGDIIPWDYDVDIGIYQDDVRKCEFLRDAEHQPVVTRDGFVWEKASEGDFYRVQYSQTNHLHVDIFPFFSKNGIMTKRYWIKSHKQDMEFPEHYLRPLATIHFIGLEASAPNNIREFLEIKFGEGVIENPQYPNAKYLKFPNVTIQQRV